MRRAAVLLVPALLAACLAAPGAASAQNVQETLTVPTVDGANISVGVVRPAGNARVPVILTYSPYNSLGAPDPVNDSYAAEFVPKGYARAVADVLGTRNSSGCWDYGGRREQQSGVDLVNFLAKQPWSNGKVAMIGGSYDGTTANMVAARGADAPGLAAIVPISAISRWYGYAYFHGVRWFWNSQYPADEGFDTPAAFDFGLARTPPDNPFDPNFAAAAADGRYELCDAMEHTERGYDSSPDYDEFWLQRDYRKDAANFRVPALIAHGWQDFNVKQEEGIELYRALTPRDGAFNRLYLYQAGHEGPPGEFLDLLTRFFERTLKGVDNGVDREPPVTTGGRTATDNLDFRAEADWPPPEAGVSTVALGRGGSGGTLSGAGSQGSASYTDSGLQAEETGALDPAGETGWLYYVTEPLSGDARIAGEAVLQGVVEVDRDRGQLAPTLFDVAPDGTTVPITRGFLNLRYRDGLAREVPVPTGTPVRATVRFLPQDWTVSAGHRIGLMVASSNVVWGIPDQPGLGVTVLPQSRLALPISGSVPAPLPAAVYGTRAASLPTTRLRLTATLRRVGRRARPGRRTRLRVSGRAPDGARVTVVVRRGSRVALRRRVTARHGAYRVTFTTRRRGRYRATVTSRVDGVNLRARSRIVRLR